MSREELLTVLEIDKLARQGTNQILYGLENIDFKNDWDYTFPTIFSPYAKKSSVISDLALFNTIFSQKYEALLSKVDYTNVIIAGGAIGSTLCQQDLGNDIDIFLYGLTPEQATEKTIELIQQIYGSYESAVVEQYTDDEDISDSKLESIKANLRTKHTMNNVRNKNCITLQFEPVPKAKKDKNQDKEDLLPRLGTSTIQIILRLYKSIQEILYGFDLGSSMIGYDGNNLYFSALGKFAYEYSANIVDPSRRSTTYEQRLYKYYRRGFHIILPEFNITKLRTEYLKYNLDEVCQLPYFPFTYRNLKGNKIYLYRLLTKQGKEKSDYQDYVNEYKIFYLNLKNLVKNEDNYYYYSDQMNFDIISTPPYISRSRIIDFYDVLEKKISRGANLNLNILSNYFSEPVNVLNAILTRNATQNADELNARIEQEKQLILSRYDSISQTPYLSWVTQNPGSQISGSFNPIISNSKDWYGIYYQPVFQPLTLPQSPLLSPVLPLSPFSPSTAIYSPPINTTPRTPNVQPSRIDNVSAVYSPPYTTRPPTRLAVTSSPK